MMKETNVGGTSLEKDAARFDDNLFLFFVLT
mgnify:CR=1 FL=1